MKGQIFRFWWMHWLGKGHIFVIMYPFSATLLHKYTNVEVDPQKKSDRKEFAIARYHAYYSPKCAFEIQLQWMVATGCILGDLVRKLFLLYFWYAKVCFSFTMVIVIPIILFHLCIIFLLVSSVSTLGKLKILLYSTSVH